MSSAMMTTMFGLLAVPPTGACEVAATTPAASPVSTTAVHHHDREADAPRCGCACVRGFIADTCFARSTAHPP